MSNILKAHRQWANRPADERYWNIEGMVTASENAFRRSAKVTVNMTSMRAEAREGELVLMGKGGIPARMTNWSFTQLSNIARTPAAYISSLPATLAAQNLNHGLKKYADGKSELLLEVDENAYVLRAITSELYKRLWDWELGKKLLQLEDLGWQVPPGRPPWNEIPGLPTRPATKADVLRLRDSMLSVKVGDIIAPCGVYKGDRDMFVFMVNESDDAIVQSPTGRKMGRGFMLWNSEVYGTSVGGMEFLYEHVCGNHIIWSASGVREFRFSHVGRARALAFEEIQRLLGSKYDAKPLCQMMKKAAKFSLGKDRVEVIDTVARVTKLTKTTANAAYQAAVEHEDDDGDPHSAWGITNGLTRISQTTAFADGRSHIDRAASKLLDLVT